MISEFAAAKINLSLAVTGKRSDGYHLIDTLVTFADVGDRLGAVLSDDLSLDIGGRFAADLPVDAANLVLRAAASLRGAAFDDDPAAPGARLNLEKTLPVASGIGGGSADAAAALRALNVLWELNWPVERLAELGMGLGADVPMCIYSRPLRACGIGETIEPRESLPPFWMVLVNPGVAVSTAEVFAALDGRCSAPLADAGSMRNLHELLAWLAEAGNDLEAPAIALAPVIEETLTALRASAGCRIARMSGSGATCFGLFETSGSAELAARDLSSARPEWWVVASR